MSLTSFSQEVLDKDVKVGLVLSGGGAKGLAHIGVLKKIEALGVRVDYIGGSSMGAVVGSLYAAGYSARQLDSIFRMVDFETLIRDKVPREAKTFFEKNESERYAISLPFDNFKLSIPSGISKGQNIYNLLSKLLFHVRDVTDFNELPIPFFCTATNIETGKEVILDKGDLPKAVSASSALPSLFSPVYIGDVLYTDGGVANNYPIDGVKSMGSDIVIGVDVQDALKERGQLKTAIEVMAQINNFRTINDMVVKKEKTDIYITPKVDDFSIVSFGEVQKIIESGEIAADQMKEQLEKVAFLQKNKAVHKKKVVNTKKSLLIKNVEIKGLKRYSRAYVMGKLKLKLPAQVEYEKFNERVNNLSATDNFNTISYKISNYSKSEDEYNLQLYLKENPSRTLLRLGIHYDNLYKTGVLANFTQKHLLTNNDVVSLDLIIGQNLRYDFNYYIDKGYYWSLGVSSSFNSFTEGVSTRFLLSERQFSTSSSVQINSLDLEYNDFSNRFFVQTFLKKRLLFSLGAEYKWLRFLSQTIGIDEDNLPRTVFENTNYGSVFSSAKYDTFNHSFFPTKGIYFEGNFNWYLLANGRNEEFEPFSIAKAKLAYAFPFFGKFSGFISSEGGFKIGDRSTRSLDFFLGGYGYKSLNNLVPFYGLEALSVRGDTYLRSELTINYQFIKKNYLSLSGNVSNIGTQLFRNRQWIDGIDYTGYAVGYAMETFFGPLEVKYSYSPKLSNDQWYVNIGFRF